MKYMNFEQINTNNIININNSSLIKKKHAKKQKIFKKIEFFIY